MKYSICFSACLLLFGCSTLFPIQVTDPRTGIEYTVPTRLHDVPGIRELAEACATQAGRVVHRTVEVEGYFSHGTEICDNACWSSFAQSPYQYMEFEVKKTEKWLFLKEKGLWRISKQQNNHQSCQAKPTKYIQRIAERDGWPADFCLAFERVDEIESQYTTDYRYQRNQLLNSNGFSLAKGHGSVIEIATGEELGYDITFTLFGGQDSKYRMESWSCPSIGIVPQGRGTGNFLEGDILLGR